MPFTPLDKRQHPDFAQKGRKPVGPVEIDRQGLIPPPNHAWYVDQTAGSSLRNFVTGKQSTIINVDWRLKHGEFGLYYLNTSSAINTGPVGDVGAFLVTFLWMQNDITSSANIMPIVNFGGVNIVLGATTSYLTDEIITIYGGGATRTGVCDASATVFGSQLNRFLFNWNGSYYDIYWNGVKQTVTAAGAGHAGFINTTGDMQLGAGFNENADRIMGYSAVWNEGLSDAQASLLSRDPYQILKPSVDVFAVYGVAGGGGTTYDVSALFGLSQGYTQTGGATAYGGITLANSISCSDAANGNYQGGATLANQLSVSNSGIAQALSTATMAASLGYSTDGIIAFLVDVSFSSTMGDTYQGAATGQGAINLGTSLDQTVSAIAQTIASVTLSTSQGLTSSSGNTIAGAISLGVSSGMTALGSFTIAGNITLSKTLADSINANAQTNASINLGAQVGLTVLAQAAAQAGITLSQVVSVVNTGTTIIFGVTTPDGRIYTVEIDTRTLTIESENRTLTVN